MNARILLVTDSGSDARIPAILNSCGWHADIVELGAAALTRAVQQRPWLIMVQATFVDHSHALFCRTLREMRELERVLIIGLTAPDDLAGRSLLLESGADACWSDALDNDALLSGLERLRADQNPICTNRVLERRGIRFDVDGQKVSLDGTPLRLTPIQMRVVRHFLEHPGIVVTPNELLHSIWGNPKLQDATVTACISTIRRIFSQAGHTPIIRKSGGGYVVD